MRLLQIAPCFAALVAWAPLWSPAPQAGDTAELARRVELERDAVGAGVLDELGRRAARGDAAARAALERALDLFLGRDAIALACVALGSAPNGAAAAETVEFLARRLARHDVPIEAKLGIVAGLARLSGADAERALRGAIDARTAPRPVVGPGGGPVPAPAADEPAVIAAAIDALGRRGAWRDARELAGLRASADADVRRAALVAEGSTRGDDAWVRELFALRDSADVALRAGAAIALGRAAAGDAPAALEGLFAFLADPEPAVRLEACWALGDLRAKSAIPRMIDQLEREPVHLAWAPHRELRLLTGEDHGASAERWRAWWSRAGAAFALPTLDAALLAELGRQARQAASSSQAPGFYGLRVTSDRVVLILDASASMTERAPTGERRADVARRELVSLLGRFPHGKRLNVIFLRGDLVAWRPRMMPMDVETRRDAVRFALRGTLAAGTPIHAALELALDDPDARELYLLSDGLPVGGGVTRPDRIVAAIERRRRDRAFAIHAIALGDAKGLLRDLAEVTGGTWTAAE